MISDCIMSDPKGCKGLSQRHPHCGSSLCPFYKTVEMEGMSQRYCEARLVTRGLDLKICYEIKGDK